MKEIIEGIKLFNDADFFSAHDFFEEMWFNCDHFEKKFFQGLIQISVGCYHLICGNFKGAKSQLLKGKTKIEIFSPSHRKVDIVLLIVEVDFLLRELENCLNNPQCKIDIRRLPTIKTQN